MLRLLKTLPVYVVADGVDWEFDSIRDVFTIEDGEVTAVTPTLTPGCIPIKDEGTITDSTDGAIGVTVLDDVTGLVAWRDYVPVRISSGTEPFVVSATGYIPCRKIGGGDIVPE